jgi:DNA-binding response OmpR family regulator
MANPAQNDDGRPLVLLAMEGSPLLAGVSAALEPHARIITCARAAAATRQREVRAGAVVVDADDGAAAIASACRRVRAVSPAVVVAAGASAREADVALALDAGADDYVAAPFGGELAARIRSLLRRAPVAGDGHITAGPLTVDATRHVARLGDRELRLTGTEFGLLAMLARHADRVVAREDLLHHIGVSTADGTQRLLRVAISRLRTRLREAMPGAVGIDAVAGVGYQLVVRGEP